MTSIEDTRVDACIYFIAPHILRSSDIQAIEAIGLLVPVIPIIAKASAFDRGLSH